MHFEGCHIQYTIKQSTDRHIYTKEHRISERGIPYSLISLLYPIHAQKTAQTTIIGEKGLEMINRRTHRDTDRQRCCPPGDRRTRCVYSIIIVNRVKLITEIVRNAETLRNGD